MVALEVHTVWVHTGWAHETHNASCLTHSAPDALPPRAPLSPAIYPQPYTLCPPPRLILTSRRSDTTAVATPFKLHMRQLLLLLPPPRAITTATAGLPCYC